MTDRSPEEEPLAGLAADRAVSANHVTRAVHAEVAKADPPPEARDKLDEDRRRVRVERARSDLKLSKVVGYGALGLMSAQLIVADAAFYFYGFWNSWHVPAAAVEIWLAAIVVQVVGVVLVITNHLFPGDPGNG